MPVLLATSVGLGYALVLWTRSSEDIRRPILVWPLLIAALALPFCLPGDHIIERFFLAVAGLVFSMKVWDYARGRGTDPLMMVSWSRFLLWFSVPPDTRWPRSPTQARKNRILGLRLMVMAVLELVFLLALLTVNGNLPEIH